MNWMIKPKFWESVTFEDGEISTVIVGGIPYKIEWLLNGHPKHTTIEWIDDSARRYITSVKKEWKILTIELWESSLYHR